MLLQVYLVSCDAQLIDYVESRFIERRQLLLDIVGLQPYRLIP